MVSSGRGLASRGLDLPPDCFGVLLNNLNLVFNDYVAQANPSLEDVLLLSPEYCFHLLNLNAQQGPLPLKRASEFYQNLLLRDARWAMQWLRMEYSELLYIELMETVWRTKSGLASSAFCYHFLRTQSKPQAERLKDISSRLAVLQRNPHYALLAGVHYPVLAEALIPTAYGRPRLLYHWLKLVPLPEKAMTAAQEKLTTDAAWTVQYIEDCKPLNFKELYETAFRHCHNSWLASWLEQLHPLEN